MLATVLLICAFSASHGKSAGVPDQAKPMPKADVEAAQFLDTFSWTDGCHAMTDDAEAFNNCVVTENRRSLATHGRRMISCEDGGFWGGWRAECHAEGMGAGMGIGFGVGGTLALAGWILVGCMCCRNGGVCGVGKLNRSALPGATAGSPGTPMQPVAQYPQPAGTPPQPAVQAAESFPKFDSQTGAPIQPRFDPNTGQRIQ